MIPQLTAGLNAQKSRISKLETNEPGAGRIAVADAVCVIAGNDCVVSSATGRVLARSTNHASAIQTGLSAIGADSVFAFRSGVYNIGTALIPEQRQTVQFNTGAIFVPAGDNAIWNLTGRDRVSFQGTLEIDDSTNHNSTSTPAIIIEDCAQSYFERIVIREYYNAINLTGTAGGTHENYFGDIWAQVRNRGLNLETSCHDNHFNHVFIKGPSPVSWASSAGLRVATSGTQGGNTFPNLEILDMDTGIDLPGGFEIWFGSVVIDNPYGLGVYIAGSCEGLFFDKIWASSGGTGVQIGGSSADLPTTYADRIHINQIYAHNNADYGVRFTGYTQQIHIGDIVTESNAQGLAFNGPSNTDVVIGTLFSRDNTNYGCNFSGCGAGCIVNNLITTDEIINLDLLTRYDGQRNGLPYSARGTDTIASGASSVNVLHGCESVPQWLTVSGNHTEVSAAYYVHLSESLTQIAVPSATTGARGFGWAARSAGPYAKNLINNPSVETGTGTPDYWNVGTGATWATDDPVNGPSSTVFAGSKSLRLQTTASTGDWRCDYFAVEASADYIIRGMFVGSADANCYFTIRWFSDTAGSTFISEDNVSLVGTHTNWTLIQDTITAPGTAQSADVMIRVTSSATVDIYADCVEARKVW